MKKKRFPPLKQTHDPQSQTRFLVLTTLAGVIFINIFLTLQFIFVLRLPLSLIATFIFSIVGAIVGFVIGGIYYQWRLYAQALRQNEQRFQAVLQHMPVMLDAYDSKGHIVFWNGECERITGYRAEEVTGQANIMDMLYPSDEQRPLINQNYRNHASKIRCRDGSIKTILWSNLSQEFPISGWAGWRIGVDISEQKRAEDALREAERDYRSLFEHIPDGIYRSAINGRQLRANPALVALNGYDNEAEMLEGVRDIAKEWYVDPTRRDQFKQLIEKNGSVLNFESEIYRHKTRERIWISESAHVVRDEHGSPLYYEGTVKDITKQKQTEEIVRTTAQIRLISDHLPVWIAYLDQEQCYRFLNKHHQTILPMPLDEAINQSMQAILGDAAFQTIEPSLEKVLAGEQATFETTLQLHDRQLYVNVMLVPHIVQDKLVGFFSLMVDIAQQREASGAAYHLQKMESLSMLAGGVANDFNNLLLVILGHISMIQGLLPPNHTSMPHLEQAANATERAANLTRQMLTYAGRGHLMTESVSLNQLVGENITAVSLPPQVSLSAQLDTDLTKVQIDASQIGQVVTALIHNSVEAIDKATGTITVTTGHQEITSADTHFWQYTVDPLAPGTFAFLEVHDTGPGMDEETLAKIFDPFFTTKVIGQGLGLASVLGIIRGHKGGLAVKSTEHTGTAFRLLLPLVKPQANIAAPPAAMPVTTETMGSAVLVIDDDDAVRAAIVGMIKPQNLDVYSANGGKQGLEIYRQHQQDIGLIILDIVMPGMDGEQTHIAIRQINPNIPIILSSGYDERDAAKRLVDNIKTGFLQKPYRAPALINAIQRYLPSSS